MSKDGPDGTEGDPPEEMPEGSPGAADAPEEESGEGAGARPASEGQGQEPPVGRAAFEPKLLVEGVLFSAGHALQVSDIEQATGLARPDVLRALRRLSSEYRRRATAIEVAKVGARWTMQLKVEATPQARSVAPPEVPAELLKTLALIAFHQPVRQSDLMEMVGPRVYDQVKQLVALGMVYAAPKGSTKVLTTTQKFLEYFGIASARRDHIKRFLAEKVGVKLPEPQPEQEAGDAEGAPPAAAPPAEGAPAEAPAQAPEEAAAPKGAEPQG